MEPERRERIAAALRDVDEIFHTWIAQRAERIMLTNDERAKFVAWLRQDADQEAGLVEFLADLPAGTNGAHIRTDCKIRRDVKRALAEEIERGR